MAKVKLTSNEFLSLYTGKVMGENFEVVKSAMQKVYGFDPFDPENGVEDPELVTVKLQKKFSEHVNENYKELADVVNELGEFKAKEDGTMEELNSYVNDFEDLIGSQEVEVDAIKLNNKNEKALEEKPNKKANQQEVEMVK